MSLPYLEDSPYYFDQTGQFTNFGGRSFTKTNTGPAYCAAVWNGSETFPLLISKDQNCVKTNNPSYEHEIEFQGETWWCGGFRYGFATNYASASRYMDVTSYAPFPSGEDGRKAIALAALDIIYDGYEPPVHHLHSAGNPEAIRDWFNASLYNKEEIDNLFIQNNQAGLIPYDLTIQGYEPEQYVKLVGQTSGKVYNLCLAALMGEDMKETVLWTNSGSTNPQTITLADDWTKYKFLVVCMINRPSGRTDIVTTCIPVSIMKQLYDGGETCTFAPIDNGNYVSYATTNDTKQLNYRASSGPYLFHSIVGYS